MIYSAILMVSLDAKLGKQNSKQAKKCFKNFKKVLSLKVKLYSTFLTFHSKSFHRNFQPQKLFVKANNLFLAILYHEFLVQYFV